MPKDRNRPAALVDPIFPHHHPCLQCSVGFSRTTFCSLVAAGRFLSFGIHRLEIGKTSETRLAVRLSVFLLPGKRGILAGNDQGFSQSEDRSLLTAIFLSRDPGKRRIFPSCAINSCRSEEHTSELQSHSFISYAV